MTSRHGFTLIEMSIVLILLGFLVGGIVLGRDLILNAQLQTIITDVNRFKNAAKLFKEKYQYLPGDLPTAETMWGPDAGCPDGDTSSNATRVVTCNGDGDGKVRNVSAGTPSTPSFPNNATTGYEALRVWQHLANARFLEGQYSGVPYDDALFGCYKPGANIPPSKLHSSAGFIFSYSDPIDSSYMDPFGGGPYSELYTSEYGHIIQYGGGAIRPLSSTPPAEGLGYSPGLKPVQALNIDKKTDDGMPSTGNVLSFKEHAGNTDCVTGATPTYNASGSTSLVCTLIFLTGL